MSGKDVNAMSSIHQPTSDHTLKLHKSIPQAQWPQLRLSYILSCSIDILSKVAEVHKAILP